jgi:hypothetical protein
VLNTTSVAAPSSSVAFRSCRASAPVANPQTKRFAKGLCAPGFHHRVIDLQGVSKTSSRNNSSVVLALASSILRSATIAGIKIKVTATYRMTNRFTSTPVPNFTDRIASVSSPQPKGANPATKLAATLKRAKKWLRPIAGTVPIKSLMCALLYNASPTPAVACWKKIMPH